MNVSTFVVRALARNGPYSFGQLTHDDATLNNARAAGASSTGGATRIIQSRLLRRLSCGVAFRSLFATRLKLRRLQATGG